VKIIIDIPDSIIPEEVRKVIDQPKDNLKEFNKKLCEAFLKFASEEIESCQIAEDES
jgi:hypothetical protein